VFDQKAQLFVLSFVTEPRLGKAGTVTGPDMPSRIDHSSFTNAVTRPGGTPALVKVNECLLLLDSASPAKTWVPELEDVFVASVVPELEDVFVASVFRKRHIAAQSSIFDVGYRVLHARRADSTRTRAAEACKGALLTMLTTSALESTSQTYSKQRSQLIIKYRRFQKNSSSTSIE
jgi:hypothetical protein